MIRTILSFIILMTILSACQTPSDDSIVDIDIEAALKNPGDFKLSDLVKDVEIITLDTVPDAFFMNIISLQLTNNYISFACNNQKRVYLFDRSGKFIRHLGRAGKGPGEYVSPEQVAMSPDEKFILVGDMRTAKIILYDIDGKFIREHKIKDDSPGFAISGIQFTDNTHFMVSFRRPSKVSENFASLLLYNLDFEITQSILPRPATKEEAMPNLIYNSFELTNDGFCFWETLKDTVYYIDKTGKAEPKYHLKIKNHCSTSYNMSADNKNCIKAMDVLDLPQSLIISLIVNENSRTVMFDKKTSSAYRIDHSTACDTLSNSWIKTSLVNDVFGIEPIFLSQYNPQKKEIVTIIRPGWTIETHDMDCVRSMDVKLPTIRDRLADLCEARLGFENAAILVMKVK